VRCEFVDDVGLEWEKETTDTQTAKISLFRLVQTMDINVAKRMRRAEMVAASKTEEKMRL
jgi:hypothetical protein